MPGFKLLKRHIALPQDHGSWVFILSPLLIGIFAGGRITPASAYLIIAAMGAFLLRQPVSIAVKSYSGRRSREDLPAAHFWMLVYGTIILLSLAGLLTGGNFYVFYLAVPGVLVFAWHLSLVRKRTERRQPGLEILATGTLALAAPAAFWIGQDRYDPLGWALWISTWLQAAASIVYVYYRLEQRELPAQSIRSDLWSLGRRAFTYTSFNLALAISLGWMSWLPRWIFIPFFLQWLETLWGINTPAIGWKPTAIGLRQLVLSALFTVLFIICWRFV